MTWRKVVCVLAAGALCTGLVLAQDVKASQPSSARVSAPQGAVAPTGAQTALDLTKDEILQQLTTNVQPPLPPKQVGGIYVPPPPGGLRQGGETCDSAVTISALPYNDTGTTANHTNDGGNCGGWGAPDVWYKYTPAANGVMNVSLCGSSYDTYLGVYTGACGGLTNIGCNDDFCSLQSEIDNIAVTAGTTYYIAVSGFSTANGAYVLNVTGPCSVPPPQGATPENEPQCADEYVDATNGGCNSTPNVFGTIIPGETIAGTSGTYLFGGAQRRDTDWFQYVATGSKIYHFTVTAEFPVQVIVLYTNDGTCAGGYTYDLATGGACQPVTINSACKNAGTFWFWVGPSVFTGVPCGSRYNATLTAEDCTIQGPVNDLCANAKVISTLPYTDSGDTTYATVDAPADCGAQTPDVWYSYTPAQDQVINVSLCGSAYDTRLAIYQGPCVGAQIGCNDDFCGLQSEIDNVAVYAGTQYIICVKGYSGTGTYTLNVTTPVSGACCLCDNTCREVTAAECATLRGTYQGDSTTCGNVQCSAPPPPPNDDCANVTPVELVSDVPAVFTGTTVNACVVNDCTAFQGYPDVWIAYTLPSVMDIKLDYCGTSPAFDNTWLNYALNCGLSCSFSAAAVYNNTECGDGNWTLRWSSVPAGTYYFPVLQDAGANGPYTIHVTGHALVAPANDNCAEATVITALPYTDTGNIGAATQDGALSCVGTGPDVWYTYTAAASATVTASLCGSSYDTALGVFTGTCGSLTEIACNDDACGVQSQVIFGATAGTTYYILVSGFAGATGPYTFNLFVPPPPPNCQLEYFQDAEAWSFNTSAVTTAFTYNTYDNYSGMNNPISSLEWYGTSLACCWSLCDMGTDPTFIVSFYDDAGGQPGTQTGSYTVNATAVDTGILYAGTYHLFHYTASLSPAMSQASGWFSVQSQQNANDCAFLWLNAHGGDGLSYQSSVGGLTLDFTWCLHGGPTICRGDLNCDGQINFGDINPFVQALSNWAGWRAAFPNCPQENADLTNGGIFPVGFEQINPFVALLSQQPPAQCP